MGRQTETREKGVQTGTHSRAKGQTIDRIRQADRDEKGRGGDRQTRRRADHWQRQTDSQTDRQTDGQTVRQAGRQRRGRGEKEKQPNKHTHTHTQMGNWQRQTDTKTHRQTDPADTGRQAGRQTLPPPHPHALLNFTYIHTTIQVEGRGLSRLFVASTVHSLAATC